VITICRNAQSGQHIRLRIVILIRTEQDEILASLIF
jgi:hypothetical protein